MTNEGRRERLRNLIDLEVFLGSDVANRRYVPLEVPAPSSGEVLQTIKVNYQTGEINFSEFYPDRR